MMDLRGKHVEILVNPNGKTLWVNTEEGCIARVYDIASLTINDQRPTATPAPTGA